MSDRGDLSRQIVERHAVLYVVVSFFFTFGPVHFALHLFRNNELVRFKYIWRGGGQMYLSFFARTFRNIDGLNRRMPR